MLVVVCVWYVVCISLKLYVLEDKDVVCRVCVFGDEEVRRNVS